MALRWFLTASAVVCIAGTSASADQHTGGVPAWNSRPGAAYTVYLNPAGFNFDGMWSSSTPGNNLGLNDLAANGTFGAADVAEINSIYAAMANQYRSFNVNVTTIDPAVAAGQAATDAQRQAYYDSQPRMMHTVIGAGNGWQGSADGLALLGVIDSVASSNGAHTNWMFSNAQNGTATVANGNYIGNISSHETGHTFGLRHQGDVTGAITTNEYGFGDDANGNGNYVATMGNASNRQRVAWRVGGAHDDVGPFIQNDVATIMSNNGMSFVDSGIGHTLATATTLPITGNTIDVSNPLHSGWVSPISSSNPQPLGVANYTTDFFKFFSDGVNPITLKLNDGNDLLSAGTADNGATFRGLLNIYDSVGTLIGTGLEDASTMFASYAGLLGSGSYYAQITSFGGHAEVTSAFNAASYYDMGGYFLTGTGFAIPAPGSVLILSVAGLFASRRRRA